MGDDTRQDEPGMKPDGIRLKANDDEADDTEGHGGGKWAGAKDDTTDTEGHGGGRWAGAKDEAPDEPEIKPEGIKRFVQGQDDADTEGHRARS